MLCALRGENNSTATDTKEHEGDGCPASALRSAASAYRSRSACRRLPHTHQGIGPRAAPAASGLWESRTRYEFPIHPPSVRLAPRLAWSGPCNCGFKGRLGRLLRAPLFRVDDIASENAIDFRLVPPVLGVFLEPVQHIGVQ